MEDEEASHSDSEEMQSDEYDSEDDEQTKEKSQYTLRQEELAATAAALLDELEAQASDSDDTEITPAVGKKAKKKQRSKKQQKLDQMLDELEAQRAAEEQGSDSDEPEVVGGKKGKKKKKNRRKQRVDAACSWDTKKSAVEKVETIRVVSRGLIAGLVSRPDLNGTVCELLELDKETGRQIVLLPDGSKMKLKPANLQDYTTEQQKIIDDQFFSEGVKQKPVKKNKKVAKLRPADGKAPTKKVAAAPAQTNQKARIVGLVKQPQLNGLLCERIELDPTGRWRVLLENGSKMMLKPANLEECTEPIGGLQAAAAEMTL